MEVSVKELGVRIAIAKNASFLPPSPHEESLKLYETVGKCRILRRWVSKPCDCKLVMGGPNILLD